MIFCLTLQWLGDVNQKVLLENGDPVPVLVLANKVIAADHMALEQWGPIMNHCPWCSACDHMHEYGAMKHELVALDSGL